MRYSRWGWSAYETAESLAAEEAALSSVLEVAPRRSDAEIVVVNSGTVVDDAFIAQVPSMQLCVTNTSGFDHLDLDLLRRKGVTVARLPLARRDAVVESAIWGTLQVMGARGEQLDASNRGEWIRHRLPKMGIQTLFGSQVAVVGLGVIGRRMAEVLKLLGARVVGVDPFATVDGIEQVPLMQAVKGADVLTLHCNLTAENRGMVGEALLNRASPGMVLVNTARGPLVHWKSAVTALDAGQLRGIYLDVFEEEPWPHLSARAGMLMTPHSAGFHQGLCDSLTQELEMTVQAFVDGKKIPYSV